MSDWMYGYLVGCGCATFVGLFVDILLLCWIVDHVDKWKN